MDIKFLFDFSEVTKNRYNINYKGKSDVTKGLYNPTSKEIFINLTAAEFAYNLSVSEDLFISTLSDTISHESIHHEIDTCIENLFYTLEGEERVCELMIG